MKSVASILASVALTGCLASTGVTMGDRGSYLISKRSGQIGTGMPLGTRGEVYAEASTFCEAKGKVVDTIGIDMIPSVPGPMGTVALQFVCILPNSAAPFHRPMMWVK